MTLDIVELLKQKVTAMVLDGDSDFLVEKKQALAAFYPFLLTLLKAKPGLLKELTNQLNPRIADLFTSNSGLKQQFLQHLSPTIPAEETEKTLNRAIAPTLSVLENEAGSSDSNAIVSFLQSQWHNIQSKLPAWALPLLTGLGVSSVANAQRVTPDPVVKQHVPEEKRSGFLLPLIGFLVLAGLLGFLFKACSKKPDTAVVPPADVQGAEPARLQLTTNEVGDVANCVISANNGGFLDTLQSEVKKIFNRTAGCDTNINPNFQADFVDSAAIPSVLNLVKGVPNASLDWYGDKVTLQTPDVTTGEALAGKIRPLLKNAQLALLPLAGPAAVAASTPAEVDRAVNDSITQAGQALSNINPDNVNAEDVAKALNIQIINFATASSAIPDANKRILDQAAALLKSAQHVKLTIEGHTDNVGSAASNKTLSLQRAEAVKKYLTSQGIAADRLTAVGFGQENPTADNATEAGKFKNRRIEFKVINTETGSVRQVDDQGIKKNP